MRTTPAAVLDRPTLVLNRGWFPVHVTTVRRAICLVYQEAALAVATESMQPLAFEDWLQFGGEGASAWIRTPTMAVPAPEVVQLLRYDRAPSLEAPFSRRNLFQRDRFTCQYCGRRGSPDKLSIDHVQPRSKGGPTSWENCVLACQGCNARKGDRSVKDAGLHLRRAPRRPRWSPYMGLARHDRLPSWQRFTPPAMWEASVGD